MDKAITISLTLLLALTSSALQRTQIQVEVEAVNLVVTVTDRKGRFITDLTREDFQIYEDGVLQEITHFSQETNLPLLIALLMDTSSSVRLKLEFEKRAATNFLYSVMRSQDRALLVEFDRGVSLLHDFTARPGAIAKEIRALRAGGGTALLDAIYLVSRDKMMEPSSRQTIVILSDGVDLDSKHHKREVMEMVQGSHLTIYAIGTTRFGASGDKRGENLLEELAEHSGGEAFFPYSTEQLGSAFELINEELRSQYSLAYVPRNKAKDGKFRKIKIRLVHAKGLRTRHRKGYFVPIE